LTPAEPLARHTTIRIGGPAELFARLSRQSALESVLAAVRETSTPFYILGLGSNVLVPDRGLEGVVAVLDGEFLELEIEGDRVRVGAGLPLARLAKEALARGLVGLEALAGFPSTVGGAVWMNAGCYGVEITDLLERATVLRADGAVLELGPEDLEPGYRRTNLQGSGAIVTRATLRLARGDAAAAMARMAELNRRRWLSLPAGRANAGSVFRNPAGDHAGRLIEACGLKGASRGQAEISAKHANVIVNRGSARAVDVLELMLLARRRVLEEFGIDLEPELVLIGELRQSWLDAIAGSPAA
jgi:UDP-N-acetylmuramate dehydrogenase